MTQNIQNPSMNGVIDYTQFYSIRKTLHSKGYFIHPIKTGEKRPLTKGWQETQCKPHLLSQPTMVGLGMGHQNLWALDVDSKNWPNGKDDLNQQILTFIKSEYSRSQYVYQYSQSGGLHIIFKIEDADWSKLGNAKFAKTASGDDILESRGYKGQIVIYDEAAIWSQLDRLQSIGMADLSKLIAFAETFHYEQPTFHSNSHDQSRWIDKGNNRWIGLHYLESCGWKIVKEEEDKYLVQRPNGNNPHHGTVWKDSGNVHLFSAGNTGLEENKNHSPYDIQQRFVLTSQPEEKSKPKKPAYEFAQMNDYLKATLSLPKLTYMMDGYICLGQLTFLFGPEKVGKTPIAMEIALNMAKGEKHFGHFKNDAGPVPTLYLDNELQARNLRKRFSSDEEQLNLHRFPDNFYRLQPDKAVTGLMSDKEIMDATLEAIENARITSNIQFVVIDNMAPLIEDEEKATNAKKFISQLIAYADKTDVGILVIQHVTKQYESQILRTSAMRGSGRLKDMAAGLIGVNINSHTGQRYLKFFPSRNVEVAENKVMKFKTVKPESLIMVEPEGWEQEEVIIQERGEDDGIEELFNLDHVEIGSAFIRLQREGLKADDIASQLGCSRQHLYDCKKVFEKWEKQNIDNKALRDKALTLSPIPSDFDL